MKTTQYLQFIALKVKSNLQSEASRLYLSYFWWIFEPLLTMLVFYLVFGLLLMRGTEDFVVFLLTGLIPWLWFSKTVSHSTNSIVQGRGLMMQVHIPKIVLPTVIICQDAVKQIIVMILLIMFLLIYGIEPNNNWFALFPILMVEFLLVVACSYFVAAIVPFLPDLAFLISVGLQGLMFCSGVFYSMEMIPVKYHMLFFLNPMASLLHNYRNILLYNQSPEWQSLFLIASFSLLAIIFLAILIRKLDHVYPRVVL